jgi:hypothetical protein
MQTRAPSAPIPSPKDTTSTKPTSATPPEPKSTAAQPPTINIQANMNNDEKPLVINNPERSPGFEPLVEDIIDAYVARGVTASERMAAAKVKKLHSRFTIGGTWLVYSLFDCQKDNPRLMTDLLIRMMNRATFRCCSDDEIQSEFGYDEQNRPIRKTHSTNPPAITGGLR